MSSENLAADDGVARRLDDSTRFRVALRALIVCLASFAGAQFDTWLRFPEIGTGVLFPPYAVLTAALLVSRPKNWIIYLVAASVGTYLPHVSGGAPASFIMLAYLANSARALVAAFAIKKLDATPGRFDSLRALGWFLLFAVFVAPSLAAFIGAGAVMLHGKSDDFWLAWRQWMLSNALTGLTMLPILLMALRYLAKPVMPKRGRIVEGALLAIGLCAVATWVFDSASGNMIARLYWPLPFLLWAAVRFGPGTTSAALACMSGQTIWGALHGRGPFILQHSPTENLLELQLFLIAVWLPLLLLSALIEQEAQTRKALHESRQQYRSIVEDQTELICRYRPDGTCAFANGAYCRFVQRTETDLIGRDLREIDPFIQIRLSGSLPREDPVATRQTSVERPSSIVFHQWRDRAFFDDRGNVVEYQSVGRDVTELVRAAEERRELEVQKQTARALREENRRKDEFLAILGHELRNPLAPLAVAPSLLRTLPTRDALVDQVSEVIERQVRQLSRIVNDLLDVSRFAQGRISLQPDALDLKSLVERAIEAERSMIEARKLTLTITGFGVRLIGDAVRLQQVATNLLHNAAKYTGAGGRIDVHVTREEDCAVLTVRDNGIGIHADMLERVFDLFTQSGGSREHTRSGLGIGLTVVKRIVEMHGGSVEARSGGLGQGTQLCVRLPALPLDSVEPVRELGASMKQARPSIARVRILIVDDNAEAADMLASLLRAQHEVHVAYDGESGLHKVEEVAPDLILVDLAMPKIDGLTLAQKIRERFDTPPPLLIAVTGFGQEEDRRRTSAIGFDYHIVKPLEPSTLMALVEEAAAKASVRAARALAG